MPQIINTNIASINAQRNLNKSQSANQSALQRLSSGLRINSAKDDAAGLAISTRFTSQIKGLNVAVRNAGDGIALAQTAEGALGTMNDNLQRIRELAVQSSNATNSDVDRDALQAEVKQLVAEITRTAEETEFNGRKLLNGDFNAIFQVGANAGQTIDVSIAELTADKLGASKTSGVSALGSDKGLQNGDLSINGYFIDPSNGGDDSFSVVGAEASAIAKVETINRKSELTGVTAKVNTNVALGASMTAAKSSGTISLNGVDIDLATGGLDAASDRGSVIASINAKAEQTGITARDGGNDANGIILEAKKGQNITVEFKGGFDTSNDGNAITADEIKAAQAATGLASGTTYGGYTLTSKDGSEIKIEGGQGTGTGDIRNAGLTVGDFSGAEAAVTSKATTSSIKSTETASTFTTADMKIAANTVVNATNNSFELSVNGADFSTLTLGTSFDAGSGNGEYDNATQLAAQINNAITNASNDAYASNANFRDANGNALVKAEATADGKGLVFTTVDKGDDSFVVARTGAGNIDLAADNASQKGGKGGAFVTATFGAIFDGTNEIVVGASSNNTLRFGLAGNAGGLATAGTATDVTIAANSYTSATAFAEAVNTGIAANTSLKGKLEASVSDDGKQVVLTATNPKAGTDRTTAITLDAASTVQGGLLTETVEKLANGDTVISDVSKFVTGYSATQKEIGIKVDGAASQDLDLSTATSVTLTVTSSASDLATAINEAAALALAGSGLTAKAVGGQVVISSNKADGTGTIELGAASTAANTVGGSPAARDAAITASADKTVDATSGTLTTGAFSVSDGTDGNAKGTFITADPDGTGTDFTANAKPLVIEAGKNDTFEIKVDGASTFTNVTIAAGSYNTLADLASAINTVVGPSATVAVDPADGSKLTFTSATTGDSSSVEIKNGKFGITGGGVQGALVSQVVKPNVLETGDMSINGTAIAGADAGDDTASDTVAETSDSRASGIAVAAAINKSSDKTGVTAEVNATKVIGGGDNSTAATATATSVVGDGSKAATGSVGAVYINNVKTTDLVLTGDENRDRKSAIDAINAISGQTGVTAEDNGESITLVAADGRNVSVAIDNKLAENAAASPAKVSTNFGKAIGLDAAQDGVGEADISGTAATYANTANTTNSTVTLTSASEFKVQTGEKGAAELKAAGFDAGSFGGGENGQYLKDIDISTFKGAQAALVAIDNAIGAVASQRADLGAIQNRMQSTVNNLQVTSENLSAANSRIQDADFAAETAELSRTQVLQQAGISILAQANASGQQVLSLLG